MPTHRVTVGLVRVPACHAHTTRGCRLRLVWFDLRLRLRGYRVWLRWLRTLHTVTYGYRLRSRLLPLPTRPTSSHIVTAVPVTTVLPQFCGCGLILRVYAFTVAVGFAWFALVATRCRSLFTVLDCGCLHAFPFGLPPAVVVCYVRYRFTYLRAALHYAIYGCVHDFVAVAVLAWLCVPVHTFTGCTHLRLVGWLRCVGYVATPAFGLPFYRAGYAVCTWFWVRFVCFARTAFALRTRVALRLFTVTRTPPAHLLPLRLGYSAHTLPRTGYVLPRTACARRTPALRYRTVARLLRTLYGSALLYWFIAHTCHFT